MFRETLDFRLQIWVQWQLMLLTDGTHDMFFD